MIEQLPPPVTEKEQEKVQQVSRTYEPDHLASTPYTYEPRRIVEAPQRPGLPDWGVIVIAVSAMLILVLGGVLLSQQFSATPTASPTTGTSSQTTSSTSNQTAPVAVPPHQTYNAQPPLAPQGNDAYVKLDVKETLISLDQNTAYHAWTFNGTVPGPIIRVRQGQLVHFTLKNDGNMPHSIDFHAAQTPWNVNYQSVDPGKSFSFTWRANFPGVFMYHCGTAPAMDHIANGMYGAIIVDPANGWAPAQEYVLVQSEFYASKTSDGTYMLDDTKLMNANPDFVTFNGYVNQYKADPLKAVAGKRIRLFIMNAGPSQFSAFHVIGAIFSDVYIDGNPANHFVGDQTVTVPPGGGTVVELTIPDAGLYPFVTHSFSDADKGAMGVIKVTP